MSERPKAPKPKGRAKPRKWSMEEMAKDGYTCGDTERFIYQTNTTIDLFGFIDFIAIGEEELGGGVIIGVQCCARSGLSNHKRKIATVAYENALRWIRCGGKIEIHAWRRIEKETEESSKYSTKWVRDLKLFEVEEAWLIETHRRYTAVPALTADEPPF